MKKRIKWCSIAIIGTIIIIINMWKWKIQSYMHVCRYLFIHTYQQCHRSSQLWFHHDPICLGSRWGSPGNWYTYVHTENHCNVTSIINFITAIIVHVSTDLNHFIPCYYNFHRFYLIPSSLHICHFAHVYIICIIQQDTFMYSWHSKSTQWY